MQTAVETLEDDKVRIRVEIDAHDVDHAFEHALSDLAKDVRVPGFRKGRAPVAVIRQRLGEEAVRDEALRSHINGWWRRATAAAGVDGIGQPEIDWDEPIEPGAPFTFTGVVQVPPKAVLPAGLADRGSTGNGADGAAAESATGSTASSGLSITTFSVR